MVFLLFGLTSAEAVAPPVVVHQGGGGRILPAYYPKKRKFTKKDERELKELLLGVVEDEVSRGVLQQKAEDLKEVANAAAGIRRAVDQAQQAVRKQAMSDRITWSEAKSRIEEIEDEEDILLILAAL